MTIKLTPQEKLHVARLLLGILAIVVAYGALVFLPLASLFAIKSVGLAGITIPFLVGLSAWCFALVFGAGVIIRLLSLPPGIAYIAAVALFFRT